MTTDLERLRANPRVHSDTLCAGRPCIVHNPSEHHMQDWPITYRVGRRIIERLCRHGVGHPDPDDLAYHIAENREYQTVHACDGCCTPPEERTCTTLGTSSS